MEESNGPAGSRRSFTPEQRELSTPGRPKWDRAASAVSIIIKEYTAGMTDRQKEDFRRSLLNAIDRM